MRSLFCNDKTSDNLQKKSHKLSTEISSSMRDLEVNLYSVRLDTKNTTSV